MGVCPPKIPTRIVRGRKRMSQDRQGVVSGSSRGRLGIVLGSLSHYFYDFLLVFPEDFCRFVDLSFIHISWFVFHTEATTSHFTPTVRSQLPPGDVRETLDFHKQNY